MTITAFIMLKIESKSNREVYEKIQELDEIVEAYLLFGAFDVILKGVFKTNKDLSDFVVDQLGRMEGIIDTLTNVCASCD